MKNLPTHYDSSKQLPSQIVLTKINYELIIQMPQIRFVRKVFDKKTKCKKLYIVVLENSSVLYAVEMIKKGDPLANNYWLNEYFTDKTVSDEFESYKSSCDICPWNNLEVFECDGIPAIAFPSYQILPISVIKNGCVTDSTLRAIHPVIQVVVQNMRKEIFELFEEYKVKKSKI